VVQVCVVESNLSIKLKDRTFPDYIYVKRCLRFDLKNLLLKSVQAFVYILYTVTFSRRSSRVETQWSEVTLVFNVGR
jgi:hypothetical protein